MYQVKFSDANPLDPEQMQIARDVFHVPQRSRFIFLNQIKQMKGSDASNVYDEEPADHELEFSDDEAEAAFKSSLKRKYACVVLCPLNPEAYITDGVTPELNRSPRLGSHHLLHLKCVIGTWLTTLF
jgi:hypothetical protein